MPCSQLAWEFGHHSSAVCGQLADSIMIARQRLPSCMDIASTCFGNPSLNAALECAVPRRLPQYAGGAGRAEEFPAFLFIQAPPDGFNCFPQLRVRAVGTPDERYQFLSQPRRYCPRVTRLGTSAEWLGHPISGALAMRMGARLSQKPATAPNVGAHLTGSRPKAVQFTIAGRANCAATVGLHAAGVDDAARLPARLGFSYEAGHDETVLNAHFAFAILVLTHHALVFLRREDFLEVSESEREGVARERNAIPT